MDTLAVLAIIGGALYLMSGGSFSNLFQSIGTTSADSGTTGQTPAGGAGILTTGQIAQLAQAAGFTGNDLITAVAIALAESGGNSEAYGDQGQYCCSYGLWQINSFFHPEFGPTFSNLYDPATNAAAAYQIYSAGHGFNAWKTFTNGRYLTFVPTVQAALA